MAEKVSRPSVLISLVWVLVGDWNGWVLNVELSRFYRSTIAVLHALKKVGFKQASITNRIVWCNDDVTSTIPLTPGRRRKMGQHLRPTPGNAIH
jgi:hypothetical protein